MIQDYFTGIEDRILEELEGASGSVYIAMAWLTSPTIKASLLRIKRSKPQLQISILVDPNKTNHLYFSNSAAEFLAHGIQLDTLQIRKFMHHKMIIIDERSVIIGSYNLTRKAKLNRENIAIIQDDRMANSYLREYRFLTIPNYMDENISILFEFPDFSQQLLATYHRFTPTTFKKYRAKIIHGSCYTADNGFWDNLYYEPGYIFNPSCDVRKIEAQEFAVPINKAAIREWTRRRNADGVIESFRDFEEGYHLINGELDTVDESIATQFATRMKHTYDAARLREMITDGVDIIMEDQLWANNFERFITGAIADQLFAVFKPATPWPKGLLF